MLNGCWCIEKEPFLSYTFPCSTAIYSHCDGIHVRHERRKKSISFTFSITFHRYYPILRCISVCVCLCVFQNIYCHFNCFYLKISSMQSMRTASSPFKNIKLHRILPSMVYVYSGLRYVDLFACAANLKWINCPPVANRPPYGKVRQYSVSSLSLSIVYIKFTEHHFFALIPMLVYWLKSTQSVLNVL